MRGLVRWERLFEDLEAQLAAAGAAELAGEVAERTRYEQARVALSDRLMAGVGEQIALDLLGGATVAGRLERAAEQWVVVRQGPLPALVPLTSVVAVTGLGLPAATAGRTDLLRRLSLGAALRAVARDRSLVHVELVDGRALTGTVDAVAADHLDLAEHPADEPRRATAVLRVRTLPFGAVAVLRPASGSSTLMG
jgi:hypothetical protein